MSDRPWPGAYYILGGPKGRTPILADRDAWVEWYERSCTPEGDRLRRVAWTDLPNGVGSISTVFLATDHSFSRAHRPVLFETMSFLADDHENYFDRYCTWEEAEAGHWAIVAQAIKDLDLGAGLLADLLAARAGADTQSG